MSERIAIDVVDELTIAQETASWDRQRTSEELNEFVARRMASVAMAEDVEFIGYAD